MKTHHHHTVSSLNAQGKRVAKKVPNPMLTPPPPPNAMTTPAAPPPAAKKALPPALQAHMFKKKGQ